jgi:alkyl sulfatase BDS1-like metallo-beta-lactamase superfamily hydrolase
VTNPPQLHHAMGHDLIITDPEGRRLHRGNLEQAARLARRFYEVRPGVWTFVGNGLSNQTFIEGPGGVIAIDTGESLEEMRAALAELRKRTAAPVVAVIYSHFHYVGGTRAVFEAAGGAMPVYGHERIPVNLARVASEIAPAYSRGLVQQFGLRMALDGPDGRAHEGLGLHFRNPEHAPYTPGYAPPTVVWRGGEAPTIAGLRVEVTHAPSDADDSITLWFPELGVCVQNIIWPTLFNIFPIRGEEYRDPQVLLAGIDHILGLGAEHLIGAHGPPLSGRQEIAARATRYRDSIQFLWDQTVRGLNKGLSADHLAHSVMLPAACDEDYLTREFYGVAEHHVRQIATGLRGWFDGDPARLFPLPPMERAGRIVRGFGGPKVVRGMVEAARAANDLRWALELATWLATQSDATAEERVLLADVLRDIAYRTTAANIRNWCLTTALDLDGTTDLSRLREHRLRRQSLAGMAPRDCLHLLRVLLDPALAAGRDQHIAFRFSDAPPAGLHIRNGVSVATDGQGAGAAVVMSYADLVAILAGETSLSGAMSLGKARIEGDVGQVTAALACYEILGLRA